jgi:hemolysin activation/secretion protein
MKTVSITLTVASALMGLLVPRSISATELSQGLGWDGDIAAFSTDTISPDGFGNSPALGVLSAEPLLPLELSQRIVPPPQDIRPEQLPNTSPQPSTPRVSPPEDILTPSPENLSPPEDLQNVPGAIAVDRYDIVGSTVFSPQELATVTQEFTGPSISFAQLLQARSAITKLYVDNGYINSGAFLPEQTLKGGVVTIQVVEGVLAEINVTGLRRLNPKYVRERVELAAGTPLNVPRLLEGLRLLQLDPLIANISAELSAGVRPGESILDLNVTQAPTFGIQALLDNSRVPSVGSERRQLAFSESTLFGQGDSVQGRYTNTLGSNAFDINYTYPLNARNGTFNFSYSRTGSQVIEDPFDILEIRSQSLDYEVGIRQPILQTTAREFALGISLSHRAT